MAPIQSDHQQRAGLGYEQPLARGDKPKGPRAPAKQPPTSHPAGSPQAQGHQAVVPRRDAQAHIEQQAMTLRAMQGATPAFGTGLPKPLARRPGVDATPRHTASERTEKRGNKQARAFNEQAIGSGEPPGLSGDGQADGRSMQRRPPPPPPRRAQAASTGVTLRQQAPALPPKPAAYVGAGASLKSLSPMSSPNSSPAPSLFSSRSASPSASSSASSPPPSPRMIEAQRAQEARALNKIRGDEHYATFVRYLGEMRKPSTYGTENELEALSRMLDRPIHVYRTERHVHASADGTRHVEERMAARSGWTIGDGQSKKTPITLRHSVTIDGTGPAANHNGNHYDMVGNLPPQEGKTPTLKELEAHTQPSTGDGACLFRSVSTFLEMEQDANGGALQLDRNRKESNAHQKLRQDVVNWERDNATKEMTGGLTLIQLIGLSAQG